MSLYPFNTQGLSKTLSLSLSSEAQDLRLILVVPIGLIVTRTQITFTSNIIEQCWTDSHSHNPNLITMIPMKQEDKQEERGRIG